MNATPLAIFKVAIERIGDIKSKLQWGFGVLIILATIVILVNSNSPVLPQIFVFAAVPLLIAMNLVDNLRKRQRFIIVLIISLMSIAFIGSGVVLSLRDRTSDFLKAHQQNYALENNLNQRYLVSLRSKIEAVRDYADYRTAVLDVYASDRTEEMTKGFDSLVNMYEDYLSCSRRLQCWPSAELDQRLTDFWYTYRPIIEERRMDFWPASYALAIQSRAENLQPPRYLSAVRRDPATGKHVLVTTGRQDGGFLRWLWKRA